MVSYDYVIAGGGIIGLTIARELKHRFPGSSVCIIEKEKEIALHSSGRNSGVLHAGFYYTSDSLKAKFTRDGNRAMTEYCLKKGLKINQCGKLIVAANEEELIGLKELKRRGDRNGVELHWMDENEIASIDPNAATYQKALYSPATATVDPVEVCHSLREDNERFGTVILLNTAYKGRKENILITSRGEIQCGYFINAAGLYADKVAQDFGFGMNYTIIPFKGIYLKYERNKEDVATNIYPVPNLHNPFLGVHFTKTVNGTIKIGPTAIPAFWRENYKGLSNFKWKEFFSILYYESILFCKNSFGFRNLAFEEIRKYSRSYFIQLSQGMVKKLDKKGFGQFLRPGIRAQLLNKQTLELVQDFVIEGDEHSMHVLNAVSPGFTCSMPFASYIVDEMIMKREGRMPSELMKV